MRILPSSVLSASRAVSASTTSSGTHAAIGDSVSLLRGRIVQLEEMVSKRDAMIRTLLSERQLSERQMHLQDDTVGVAAQPLAVVSSSEELEAAFKQRVSAIALTEGHRYVLLPQPCRVRDGSVTIFGKAVVEGSLQLSNATLDATDVTFISPCRRLPAIDATGTKSRVILSKCTVMGGRDGLHLSNGAKGVLQDCIVRENIRGVFEGLSCSVDVLSSSFEQNWFHAVLLGNPRHERALSFFAEEPVNSQSNVCTSHADTRADVVLQYNPMEDRYTDVFKDRVPVVLTDEASTANLCDPSW